MSANPNCAYMPRAELHKLVVDLRAQGLTFKEIAATLGRAKSSITGAYYDPTGEKDRARKRRHHGTCVDCGANTYNSGSTDTPKRCWSCAHAYAGTLDSRLEHGRALNGANRRWSDRQILDAIRATAVDGVGNVTRYDEVYEDVPRGTMPSRPTIIFRFGRWSTAVKAAGLTCADRPAEYRNRMPREGLLLALEDCAADVGRWPTADDYTVWARKHGTPTVTIVRQRFGTWMNAIDLCVARAERAA